jgi:heme-degrading monooxygenase HmoA
MMVALFGIELRPDIDRAAYEAHNRRMEELVREMPGFISVQSYSAKDGDHVTIVRFESEAALDAWRFHPEHVEAQQKGRESYYASYWVQVCKTIREYDYQHSARG